MKMQINPWVEGSPLVIPSRVVLMMLVGTAMAIAAGNCCRSVTWHCGNDSTTYGYSGPCGSHYVETIVFSTYETCICDADQGAKSCEPDGTNTCSQVSTITFSVPSSKLGCGNSGTTNTWNELKSKPSTDDCEPGC